MINFPLRQKKKHIKELNSSELKDKIIRWGATVAGFGDVSTGLAPDLAVLPTAIALAVRHPVGKGTYKCGTLTAYSNQFEEVDRVLTFVQKELITLLKAHGWRSLAIPPDSAKVDGTFISRLYPLFPHKTAATCAGLGWIGKSGLLINKDYGARLSWATVLTDAPLEVSQSPCTESRCGSCSRCVKACPASAVRDNTWVRGNTAGVFIDAEACARHLEYTGKVFQKYICGLCVLACPMGWEET